jgi:xanthine dehydrogenase YagS FAD-binding subunit
MRDFAYTRAGDTGSALAVLDPAAGTGARPIAGGTELVNLLKERIEEPDLLVDINGLPLAEIAAGGDGLRLGALARMSDVAADPAVRAGYPVIAQALELSASPQLRNMASMGGNLLQRTRCPYFRADAILPCNKRTPGSGCAALGERGQQRTQAIFGASDHCVATHPSDVAVALAALDAQVHVTGPAGTQVIALADFHRLPGDTPERDTVLPEGALVTGITVPASPVAARSVYLKVRERASYEFALVSAAVAVEVDDGAITAARIALGGVAPKPWRLPEAEAALAGVRADDEAAVRAAVEPSFAAARPLPGNAFKVELAVRTVVRALAQAAGGAA